ncbi:hypothetical protein OIU84_026132 [Salix udensis]|uniref:Uncharacterized protein n=1 Tax=Salix udensis TaxID=889485 RepID=A0AAD6KL27_9ROSI|nr:hypothetical protein OIU84_026132 [Salix udensis]
MLWVLSTRWWKSMKLHSKQWWKKYHPLLVLSGNDTSVQLYSLSMKEIDVNTTGSYHLIFPPATGPFLAETSIKLAVTSRDGEMWRESRQ